MDFKFIGSMLPELVPAIKNALIIACSCAVIGWVLGLFIALARLKKIKGLSQFLAVYVSFFRSVPIVILLFFIYFALPTVIATYQQSHGLPVTAINGSGVMIYPIIAMSLSESAFASETFRAAISAVPHVQDEAARSVGMTGFQAYTRIILPQAFVVALPNLGGLFLSLVKDSSLAYYASVIEITGKAYTLASPTYQFLEAFFVIALIYEALSFIFSRLFSLFESRLSRYKSGAVARAKEAKA